jgi:hypothetical protein
MNRLVAAALASVATLGLLSACGDSKKSLLPSAPASVAPGDTLPGEATLPGGTILPSGATIPEATIDLMISQLEASGMKVDKACFTALLSDESMRSWWRPAAVERHHQR